MDQLYAKDFIDYEDPDDPKVAAMIRFLLEQVLSIRKDYSLLAARCVAAGIPLPAQPGTEQWTKAIEGNGRAVAQDWEELFRPESGERGH